MIGDSHRFPVKVKWDDKITPRWVKWSELDEVHAMKIHNQSLEQLSSRHGLDPTEIVMNVEKRDFDDWKTITKQYALEVVKRIAVED